MMGKTRHIQNVQVIALSFLLLIALGAGLLMLPASVRDGAPADFTTALFTSVSASCVTGLVLQDTGTYWSRFGQTVILCLIQLGGLGFITVAAAAFASMRRTIGLRGREMLLQSMSGVRVKGIMEIAKMAVLGTLLVEGVGALLLLIRFVPLFGFGEGLYYAVFHAISAFCNAGFDLMGVYEPFCSFVPFANDALVSLTLCALILIGGAGFFVWQDIKTNGRHFKKYTLHTKLTLVGGLSLTLLGTVLLLLSEWDGSSPLLQLLKAFFGSVTARTAGFNTTDTGAMRAGGRLTTMLFMFIGGGTGSTAGGIKITTAAVLLLYALSGYRGGGQINAFRRSVDDDALKRAVLVCLTNFLLAFFGAFLICLSQPLPLSDVMFEAFSAIGTVGMTTGITRSLNGLSRYTVIFLMFLGRVGSISFALALFEKRGAPNVRQPIEPVSIG